MDGWIRMGWMMDGWIRMGWTDRWMDGWVENWLGEWSGEGRLGGWKDEYLGKRKLGQGPRRATE